MRIDMFLTSKKLLKSIKKVEIQDNIYGSDHLPIILEFNL
jgi:exonuclease III